MKIAAIQGYTGKEYKKNFGKKEDTPKNEAKISSPRSGKVSVLKMLPVMLAMAGMQPVATAASPLSSEAPQYFPVMPVKQDPPQVYPKSDSRYDPQYDGESKYLYLNLNELYFYAFNCERSPKLIDMNELFDLYMENRIDWESVKKQFKFNDIQMGKIQRGVDYFKDVYILRQYVSKEAIENGEPDPYDPEILKTQPKLRPHYRQNQDLSLSMFDMNINNIYTTAAMSTATYWSPAIVSAKLFQYRQQEKSQNPEIEPANEGSNSSDLKYKDKLYESVYSGPIGFLERNRDMIDSYARNFPSSQKAINEEITKENKTNSSSVADIDKASDFAPPAAETRMMKTVYHDLQNLLYTKGIEPGNVQILEETDENVKMKVKTNSFTTLLDVRQADDKVAYTSGVLETNDDLGKRKMEMLAMTHTDGELIYAFFRDVDTDNVYGVMTDNNKKPYIIDYTEQGKKASLLEMGNAIEEGMISNYYAAHADDPVEEGDLSYFSEVAMFDNWKETREKTYNDAMEMEDYFTLDINVNEDMDLENFPEDLLVDDTTYESDSTEALGYSASSDITPDKAPSSYASQENELSDDDLQAAIEQAKKMVAAQEAKEKEEQGQRSLPIILGLTALGGVAAGAGGRKAMEVLKNKNINVKDLMMKVRQKLSETIAPPEAYREKHTKTEDPKKTYWK